MMLWATITSFVRRNSATIYLTVIVLSIIGIFFLQTLTLSRIADQVHQQKQTLEGIAAIAKQIRTDDANRDAQIVDLNNHIDCIVKFFSQPDRTNMSIADIQACRLATDTSDTSSNSPQGDVTTGTSQAATAPALSSTQPTSTSSAQAPTSNPSGSSSTTTPPSSGSKKSGVIPTVSQVLQAVTNLPSIFIRQLPVVGGKP